MAQKKNSGQITRIQSLFLFLASGAGSFLFGLPFASAPNTPDGLLMDGYLDINDNIGLMILTVLTMLISLVTIFLYDNRPLQMNLGKLNILLTLGLFAFAGYLFYTIQSVAAIGGGLFVPVVVAFLLATANFFIQKDEKMVRDSNRLR